MNPNYQKKGWFKKLNDKDKEILEVLRELQEKAGDDEALEPTPLPEKYCVEESKEPWIYVCTKKEDANEISEKHFDATFDKLVIDNEVLN